MKILKRWFKRIAAIEPTKANPRVFLEEMIENCARFKSVMVVIQYHDGSMDCDWSEMTTEQVAIACIALDHQMRSVVIDKRAQ